MTQKADEVRRVTIMLTEEDRSLLEDIRVHMWLLSPRVRPPNTTEVIRFAIASAAAATRAKPDSESEEAN